MIVRLIRGAIRGLRLILRTVGGLWSAMMILLMAGSFVLSVAMTVSPMVFAAVSGAVETVTGARTLRKAQAAREVRLADDVARAESRAVRATSRADNVARELTDSRAAQARLARELADSRVTYRGQRRLARDAVADTSRRVAGRVERATVRNVASTFGEALPVVGIGVIAAATAWELHDACSLMDEMYQMDLAFNPEHAIDGTAVCGLRAPTRTEIWARIRQSPSAVWATMMAQYAELPDLSLGGIYGGAAAWFGGVYDWAFGEEPPEEVAP